MHISMDFFLSLITAIDLFISLLCYAVIVVSIVQASTRGGGHQGPAPSNLLATALWRVAYHLLLSRPQLGGTLKTPCSRSITAFARFAIYLPDGALVIVDIITLYFCDLFVSNCTAWGHALRSSLPCTREAVESHHHILPTNSLCRASATIRPLK